MADDKNKPDVPLEDPVLADDNSFGLVDILRGNLKKEVIEPEIEQSGNSDVVPGKIFKQGFVPPVRFGLKLQNESIRQLAKKLLEKYDAEKVISILFEIDEAVEKGIISNEYIYTLYTNPNILDEFEKNYIKSD